MELARQSSAMLWGTTSRARVRLVTKEHAARRGRLESQRSRSGRSRRSEATRSLQSPGSQKLSSLQSEEGAGGDQASASTTQLSIKPGPPSKQNQNPPISAPLPFPERNPDPIPLPPAHIQHTMLITPHRIHPPPLARCAQEGLEARSEGHSASKLENCCKGGARLRAA